MAFTLDITTVARARQSAAEWQDQARVLLDLIRGYQRAIRDDSPEAPALLRDASGCVRDTVWLPPWEEGSQWRTLVRVEPALAAALVALGKALDELRLDSAWGPWDDEHEPPWMAEVERTLAELTAALDGRDRAQAWTTTAQPSTPSLKLGKSQDEVPEVCGEAWDRFVSFAQFEVLKFLLAAWPRPVRTEVLEHDSGHASARRLIRELIERDPPFWERAIQLPDPQDRNTGYAIRPW